MNALQPNDRTGFLESVNPTSQTFDSARKLAFLQLANEMADNEQAPNLTHICKAVGVTLKTFHNHLHEDEVFRDAWDETRLKIEDALQRSLVRSGVKGAHGTTAAIFWLKNRASERWSDGNPQLNLDASQLKNIIGVNQPFIDVEVVPNRPITGTALEINTNSSSKDVQLPPPTKAT